MIADGDTSDVYTSLCVAKVQFCLLASLLGAVESKLKTMLSVPKARGERDKTRRRGTGKRQGDGRPSYSCADQVLVFAGKGVEHGA